MNRTGYFFAAVLGWLLFFSGGLQSQTHSARTGTLSAISGNPANETFPALSGNPANGTLFQGYQRSIRGGGFHYHSPLPDAHTSLLIRATDSTQYIEWETESLPAGFADPYARFIWAFGIDANPTSYAWKVLVNGHYLLTFHNPVRGDTARWEVGSPNGASLRFRPTLLDKFGDPMGFALLTVPAALLIPGKPQTIRIVGESAGKSTWYMTFESLVEEQLLAVQKELIVRKGNRHFRVIEFIITHLGEAVPAEISFSPDAGTSIFLPSDANQMTPDGSVTRFVLQPGLNRVPMLVPDTTVKTVGTAWLRFGKEEPFTMLFKTDPVRPWTIYLVQHTHTDIGYTRPQTEILAEHLRYIDYALDFCDLTDHYPPEAQFRWTCETSWPVREYLLTRSPRQIDRLRQRAAEGRIEVTGLFLNGSDLSDEATVAASLQPIRLIREAGIPVGAAMQNDINGIPWCMIDYLSGAGVEFLSMGQHTHRALRPFDKPTTFWWESPSGKRILVNRPEHYMTGNKLGILTGVESFAAELTDHLKEIRHQGYPYPEYAIQFSGYLTDNAPPSTTACDIVREWNETYLWPRLKLATVSEFMQVMKERYGDELPTYRGAWPDWWMDGFGSAPIETAYARMAHADNIANQQLAALSVILGNEPNEAVKALQQQVDDALLFYDEHTFGAAESISDPLCENSIVQKGEKLAYVWEAVKKSRLVREMLLGRIQDTLPKTDVAVITVLNTLNRSRSGVVTFYADHALMPEDRSVDLVAEDAKPVPFQLLRSRDGGSYWVMQVNDVPPLGYRTYRIMPRKSAKPPDHAVSFTGTLENRFYRIGIDPLTGRIHSWYDKEMNRELIDPGAPYPLGTVIRETLGKNRAQLEHFRLEEWERSAWSGVRVATVADGLVWKSLTLTGELPGCAEGAVTCEIRLYHGIKQVECSFSLKKLAVTDPEALYVSFPFSLSGSHFSVELAGGVATPGDDQLEGSASDWIGIQDFVALRSDSAQIVFVSPEIPLVQLGGLNLGEFSRIAHPDNTWLYSWVMNNYWTTNFLAGEEGELKWRYLLTSSDDPSTLTASRFGQGNRIPFLTRISPPKKSGAGEPVLIPRSFMGEALRDILLVSAKPSSDGKGVLLQLRETNGDTVRVPVRDYLISIVDLVSATRTTSVTEVNVLEEEIAPVYAGQRSPATGVWVEFKPFETKFFLLGF